MRAFVKLQSKGQLTLPAQIRSQMALEGHEMLLFKKTGVEGEILISKTDADYSRLQPRGKLTLPKSIKEEMGVSEGDNILFIETETADQYLIKRMNSVMD